MLLFADANVTNKLLSSLRVDIKWGLTLQRSACRRFGGQVEGYEGLREQTVPRNPDLPFSPAGRS